jgi:hypothetical protein
MPLFVVVVLLVLVFVYLMGDDTMDMNMSMGALILPPPYF